MKKSTSKLFVSYRVGDDFNENWQKNDHWLNEYGERYWYKNSDITITAHRSFHWVDRISFIKESNVEWMICCSRYGNVPSELIPYGHYTTTGRNHLGGMTYTKFKEKIDEWTPIDNFDDYIQLLKFEYECRKYNV